jgi:hypothetical protein
MSSKEIAKTCGSAAVLIVAFLFAATGHFALGGIFGAILTGFAAFLTLCTIAGSSFIPNYYERRSFAFCFFGIVSLVVAIAFGLLFYFGWGSLIFIGLAAAGYLLGYAVATNR